MSPWSEMVTIPSGLGHAGNDNGSNAGKVSFEELEDRFEELWRILLDWKRGQMRGLLEAGSMEGSARPRCDSQ